MARNRPKYSRTSTSYELSQSNDGSSPSFDCLARPESRVATSRGRRCNLPSLLLRCSCTLDPAVYLFAYFFQSRNALPPGLKEPRSIRVMRDSYADPIRHLKSTLNPLPSTAIENRSLPARAENKRRELRNRVFERTFLFELRRVARNARLGNWNERKLVFFARDSHTPGARQEGETESCRFSAAEGKETEADLDWQRSFLVNFASLRDRELLIRKIDARDSNLSISALEKIFNLRGLITVGIYFLLYCGFLSTFARFKDTKLHKNM